MMIYLVCDCLGITGDPLCEESLFELKHVSQRNIVCSLHKLNYVLLDRHPTFARTACLFDICIATGFCERLVQATQLGYSGDNNPKNKS